MIDLVAKLEHRKGCPVTTEESDRVETYTVDGDTGLHHVARCCECAAGIVLKPDGKLVRHD